MKRSCLSIAGLDPSGGAGVLVDAAVFRSLGFHPACIVAALTVQDTAKVSAVVGVDSNFIRLQADAIVKDLDVAAVKVGVLWSRENVRMAAELLQRLEEAPRVVDPVLKAKGGERLLEEGGVDELISKLLPAASLATPNVEEAEELTGVRVKEKADVEKALHELKRMGVEIPVVKGLVRDGRVVDAVLYDGETHFLEARAVGEVRGSGCVFSAALTAYLARGLDPLSAVREARGFAHMAMSRGVKVGLGFKVVDPLAHLSYADAKLKALEEVKTGLRMLEAHPELTRLMPEVRMNLVVAPEGAEEPSDVVGVEGRVTVVDGRLRASGPPWFGASSHLARLLLEVRKLFPELRAALNVKYSSEVVEACRALGLKLAKFSRVEEPPEVREVEGMSLRWGVEQALKEVGESVDAIYDEGGVGKEAMVRLLGRSAEEVVEKAVRIAEQLGKLF